MASSSSSSKWSKTLDSRLGKLSGTSSKESFQTLARWIVFHRKHVQEFGQPVLAKLATARSAVVVSVLNALFLLYKGKPEKWTELADLRVKVANHCLVDSKAVISPEGVAAIKTHLDDWEANSCFGETDIVAKIKRKLNGESLGTPDDAPPETTQKGSTITTTSTPAVLPYTQDTDNGPIAADDDIEPMDEDAAEPSPTTKTVPNTDDSEGETLVEASSNKKRKISFGNDEPTASKRTTSPIPDLDSSKFEELGIKQRTVEAAELLEPCRTLATLQIGRDHLTEKVHGIANLLQELPEEVRLILANSSKDLSGIDDKKADELSRLVADELLDLDLAVHLAAVRSNRTLVEQQNTARLAMIRLLQEARCLFGSFETAKLYNDASVTDVSYYNDQTQELVDLLDLEGLEIDKVLVDEDKLEESELPFQKQLPPISWYEDMIKENDTNSC